ncbi:MAG: aminoacetone oxidase family FAD-binding enzyme [Rikenellaceae bacterium]
MKIAIIGGGAAGFFAAINIKKVNPLFEVTIFEAAADVLSKVRVSGGGRCNLTNSFAEVDNLAKVYPRGEKIMRHALKVFSHTDAYEWFESHGVELTTQEDCCVFPRSQSSEEIISCFLRLAKELGINIKCNHRVSRIEKGEDFVVTINDTPLNFDKVVVTSGGAPTLKNISFLEGLPLKFIEPCPSLFSLKINNPITELMGVVMENTTVTLKGTKIKSSGALLITHWGVSAPAILKLSSYAARILKDKNYCGEILINWTSAPSEGVILSEINRVITYNSRKLVSSIAPFGITNRLWLHLMSRADISTQRRWAELGTKGINRIVATLMADEYTIAGKSTHTEEFVTCGGVDLKSINPTTLEARKCQGLYFAGEVTDVDAITGGFNLQAAWSMGYVVAKSISE